MNPMPSMSESAQKPRRHLFLQVSLLVLASVLIGRSVVEQNPYGGNLKLVEAYVGNMPTQGRLLMIPLLNWANRSPLMIRLYHLLWISANGPDELMMQIVNSLAIIAIGLLLVRLRRSFAPASIFDWLAPSLALWMIACDYVVRYESRCWVAYDILAIMFFALGLVACAEGNAWLLALTFVVGTYNREITIFLLPIWLLLNWKSQSRAKVLITTALCAAIWVAVKLHIAVLVHHAASGLEFPILHDIKVILLPHHWAQVASVAGFLVPPIIVFRGYIRDPSLKLLWLGYAPWIAATLVMGWWNETRVFGEIIPVAALTAAIQFEQYLRDRFFAAAPPLTEPAAVAQPLSNS